VVKAEKKVKASAAKAEKAKKKKNLALPVDGQA
jgi:hypothetical protein